MLGCLPMARKTWVQSQVESYQRLKKWCLMPPCLTLSIIRYGSRIKWSNPRKGVARFPTPWCSSYRKGRLGLTLDYSRQLYLLIIQFNCQFFLQTNGIKYRKWLDISIWSIHGTTILGQSEPGSNDNDGVLHIPQSSRTGHHQMKFRVISRTFVVFDCLNPLERCSGVYPKDNVDPIENLIYYKNE